MEKEWGGVECSEGGVRAQNDRKDAGQWCSEESVRMRSVKDGGEPSNDANSRPLNEWNGMAAFRRRVVGTVNSEKKRCEREREREMKEWKCVQVWGVGCGVWAGRRVGGWDGSNTQQIII